MVCLILQTGRELSLVIKWRGGKLFFRAYWIQDDCSSAEEVSVFFFFLFCFFLSVRYKLSRP